MRPFDLEKALAGAPLVTGGGKKVVKFLDCGSDTYYELELEEGKYLYCDKDGRCGQTNIQLFLAEDEKKAPDAIWMQMFVAFVGQEWSDEMEFDEICQVVDKAYAAVDKHFAGKGKLG